MDSCGGFFFGSSAEDRRAVLEDISRVCPEREAHIVFQHQFTIRIQQYGQAVWVLGVRIEHSPQKQGQGLVGIRPQLKLELLVLRPSRKRFSVIKANTDDLHTERVEIRLEVAVPATLYRSTIGPCSGEKPHHRGSLFQVRRTPDFTVLVHRMKARQRPTTVHHFPVQSIGKRKLTT